MKRRWLAVLLAWIAIWAACDFTPRPMPPVDVYFSPKGGVTDAVVREIDRAGQNILVQAYSFTSTPIANALIEAQQRGVHVQVILDESNRTEKYSAADFLLHANVPVAVDAKHAIAHNKILILDGQVVVTGSFNFTKQAETSNAENLLILRDVELAARYTENWNVHAAHCEPYVGRAAAKPNHERSP